MGYMKCIGVRLGRREKVKRGGGDLWDWIKSKIIETYYFHLGGCR